MKVAYFTRYIPHYRKEVLEEISRQLDGNFTVYAFFNQKHAGKILKSEDVNIKYKNNKTKKIKLPFVDKYLFFNFLSTAKIIKNEYDIYLFSGLKTDITVWLNLLIGHLFNRKNCIWGHLKYKSKIEYYFRKVMLNLANAAIFYDDNTKQMWINKGIKKEKLFVAPNTINTKEIFCIKKSIDLKKYEKFVKEKKLSGRNNVIFSARLQKRRKINTLIDSIGIVKSKIPNIHLWIIGNGPEYNEIKKYIKIKKLTKYITLVGALYNEEILAYYFLSSKVAAIPGSVGLFVHHAFAYGLPLIIGDNFKLHGPEADFVKNNETGLICSFDKPNEFADAIIKIISNSNFRNALSTNALNVIKYRHNVESMASGFMNAFNFLFKE